MQFATPNNKNRIITNYSLDANAVFDKMPLLKKIADNVMRLFVSKLADLKPQAIIAASTEQTGYVYNSPLNAMYMPDGVIAAFQKIVGENVILPVKNLFFYKNVFITNEGVIFRNFKISPHSLTFFDKKFEYYNTFFLKQWVGQEIIIAHDKLVIVVHNSNSVSNYYHWLVEVCSKLMLLNSSYTEYPVVVAAPAPLYIAEIIKLLGYNNLIYLNERQLLKAELVLLVERTSEVKDNTFNCYDTHQDPELIHLFRNKILAGLHMEVKKPFRLLYISRAKQNSRRIINENETVSILDKCGFEVIYFENISFAQQVKLMNEAAIIVGSHGANLTNILFMQSGAVVIELINKVDFNSVFFRLASYTKLLYYRLLCEPQEGIANERADIKVDLENLQLILKQIMSLN